jgi:hypothetical protein
MEDKKIQKIANQMILIKIIKNIITIISYIFSLIFIIALFRVVWYFAFIFNYL